MTDADDAFHLGTCCYCEQAPATVIAMLGFKVPEAERSDHGGWGCVVCGLPSHGAISVFCEPCGAELETDETASADFFAWPTICLGDVRDNRRVQVEAIRMEPHDHDVAYHPEIRGRQHPGPAAS